MLGKGESYLLLLGVLDRLGKVCEGIAHLGSSNIGGGVLKGLSVISYLGIHGAR